MRGCAVEVVCTEQTEFEVFMLPVQQQHHAPRHAPANNQQTTTHVCVLLLCALLRLNDVLGVPCRCRCTLVGPVAQVVAIVTVPTLQIVALQPQHPSTSVCHAPRHVPLRLVPQPLSLRQSAAMPLPRSYGGWHNATQRKEHVAERLLKHCYHSGSMAA